MQKSISYFPTLWIWITKLGMSVNKWHPNVPKNRNKIGNYCKEDCWIYIQYTYKKSRTKILHYHRWSQLKSCGVYVHKWVRKPQTNYFFFLQKNVSERVCPRDILTKYFFHPKRMMISQVFICLRGLGAWCEKLYSFFLERREFQSIF